ncbi:MAG: DUF459 domain-containing protein [Alphaproteobacteria bacterium]|nr:DUF459 domain-containing protein [Alphaproteobacteria bacterium]
MSQSVPAQRRRCARPSRRLAIGFIGALLWSQAASASPPSEPSGTVVVIGDSQAQGVAGALQRLYLRDPRYRIVDRSKIGTGIVTRAGYDWPAVAREIAAAHRGEIAIVMFGANDRPPFHVDRVEPALIDQFRKLYGKRVREIIRALRDAAIDVIWLGHPIVRDSNYTADMAFLNGIYEQAASEEGARWLPLWDLVADASGGYTAFGKSEDGESRRMRADDGVHFTAAGYDLVASRLRPLIEAHHAMLSSGTPRL